MNISCHVLTHQILLRMFRFGYRLAVCLFVLAYLTPLTGAHANCPAVGGDVTGDGKADVVDVQCVILGILLNLAGNDGDLQCATEPVDVNCDFSLNVVDSFLCIQFALGAPLGSMIDSDSDGCIDACLDSSTLLCGKGFPICTLNIEKDEFTSCFLRMAASSQADDYAASVQLNLTYDVTATKLVGFYDQLCFPNGCFVVAVVGPGAFPLSTGHSVTTFPGLPKSFAGTIGIVIAPPSGNFTAPITTAYLSDTGELVGDPSIMEIRFVGITAGTTPVCVDSIAPSFAGISTGFDATVMGDGLIVTFSPK
ncbi:MAG: hypothetical protein HUU55_20960 [Myxococcales bacterium]|nr:hypothetical protein [Myxococcales bacterium]